MYFTKFWSQIGIKMSNSIHICKPIVDIPKVVFKGKKLNSCKGSNSVDISLYVITEN